MKVTVIGTGYVGLVSGACLADVGNRVVCQDTDRDRIIALKEGRLPFHEPGLDELVARNLAEGRLSFTTEPGEALAEAQVAMIAVGTPPGEDGAADLGHVLAVARTIGRHLEGPVVVATKSTVPVGTAEQVRSVIAEELRRRDRAELPFEVAANPEFLKEGAAVADFMKPDRIIIGTDSERARQVLARLYAPFQRNHERILEMGLREAEMTKYAANAMLATKISFMNEIAGLCERLDVDVEQVRLGIGSDPRIGYHFIYPGAGFGGSCFPKDVRALIATARGHDFEPEILAAVERRNAAQKRLLGRRILSLFGEDLSDRRFALWGLAFKPGTDDMREAPSIPLITEIVRRGGRITAHDPVARANARRAFPAEWEEEGRLRFATDPYAALDRADALILMTEWKLYRNPDFEQMKERLAEPALILDGRNQYDPAHLEELGIAWIGVGRANPSGRARLLRSMPQKENTR
ncbi:MAG: UDP-glucose/GDP-mannose dehydrogenase family protein [Alphaproteobacteria bacterium]|nr:MAG: UDP-glucose/GDP-mannose dehydrogenase family protein [Alphaproteobacteria bacterium]